MLESLASTIRNSEGEVAKLVILNRDVTERKRAEQQLEHNLFHDPLTGLPNRRLVLDWLQHALVRARRDLEQQYALLLANAAAADPKLTVTVLSHLKHTGIGVILDDFGVGSASLRGLWQFPIDALKIDRTLVRDMQSDRTSSDGVELTVTLAQKMNLKLIAEGLETVRQVERMRELGWGGQGYYSSQPMDAKGAQVYLREQVWSKANGAGR